FTYRNLLANTRDSFLGVVSGISKIRADRSTIVSNESSLQAIQNAYQVGTRTMSDVLTSQSHLYQSEKTYMADQYSYIINTLTINKTWLDSHSQNYTIALFDTKTEQHAKNFIKTYHLEGKAVYYKANTSEGTRYRVIYGNYPTANDAELAIQKLPDALKNLLP